MSQKRQQDDGKTLSEGNSSEDKRRKLRSFKNVIMEVIKLRKVQRLMEPVLEPVIRRVVKEEVDLALRKYLTSMKWNSGKETECSESRSLQLQFQPKISLPVFTGTRIEGEDSNSLKVVLINAQTGQIVTSGPESSAKVEIVVLEGDFDGDEAGIWTAEEFKNNIVRERAGKKSLLMGDPFLNLKDGIGLIGDISFTDNSSWTRSRKFRLGSRVVDNFEGIAVREAKTEPIIVRDHRGELYKKHHPPSLFDEVWRLEKIGKDGAFHKRLTKENVYTVKDFLTLLFIKPARLRNILGSGMSAKMWEVTVEHAQTCVLDTKFYLYCPGSDQKTGVAFNTVGQVMGMLSEFQYTPFFKLSITEKDESRNLVVEAFEHWEKVISFDDEASLVDSSLRLLNDVLYSNSTMVEDSDISKNLNSQKVGGIDYLQPGVCSPDELPTIFTMEDVRSLDDFCLHDLRYDQPSSFSGQTNSLICRNDSMGEAFCGDEHLQYFDSECALKSQNFPSGSHDFLSESAAFAQKRWTMLFGVLRWFSIMRRIVAKRTQSKQMLRFC
ncbi:hypothetical protein NMG60_11004384 [Bertholletia excelsa]